MDPFGEGVHRGPNRVATGDDGFAYWTGDHYESFLVFRGSRQ
ncbi:hypothetical protein J4030_17450 [Allobranchiibius sp. CTAmp26]|nr:hypothetical protein [Allobranchiibius sp. CTAmp26]